MIFLGLSIALYEYHVEKLALLLNINTHHFLFLLFIRSRDHDWPSNRDSLPVTRVR